MLRKPEERTNPATRVALDQHKPGRFRLAAAYAGLAAVLAATAPAAEAAGWSRESRPDASGRVAACCASMVTSGEPTRRFVAYDEVRHESLVPPERLRELRQRAWIDPDLPPGREIADAPRLPLARRGVGQASRSATLLESFDGLDKITAAHQGRRFFPADTHVAAGPTRVLEVSNVGVRLSDRDGEGALVRSLNDFFGDPSGPVLFDPKVYFDRLSGRFLLVALSRDEEARKSGIHVSVSRSDAPQGLEAPAEWCNYRLNGRRGSSWADYPGLGANERWLVVSVNNFRFSGGFNSVFLYALSKPDLVDNAAECPSLSFHRFKVRRDARGNRAFTLQPAQHYTASEEPSSPFYLVSTRFARSDDYVVWRLLDNPGAKPTLAKVTVDGGALYDFLPFAPQKGGDVLDTGDQRMMQVAARDGRLWAVHATGCAIRGAPNETCIRAVEIVPDGAGAEVTFLDTFGRDRVYLWWPGIAVNERGDVVTAFQRSAARRRLETGYSFKRPAAADFGPLKRLKRGTCPLDDFNEDLEANRTGDYVGAQTDPLDDVSFWIAGQYPAEIPGSGCEWKTRIGRVR